MLKHTLRHRLVRIWNY